MTKRSITVRLEDGLDARPVALLVQEASKYESNIYFEVDDKRINAKSIMGMMSLGLCAGEGPGHRSGAQSARLDARRASFRG